MLAVRSLLPRLIYLHNNHILQANTCVTACDNVLICRASFKVCLYTARTPAENAGRGRQTVLRSSKGISIFPFIRSECGLNFVDGGKMPEKQDVKIENARRGEVRTWEQKTVVQNLTLELSRKSRLYIYRVSVVPEPRY